MKVPAYPPEDFKGSISDWMTALKEEGLITPDTSPFRVEQMQIDHEDWMKVLQRAKEQ